MLLRQDRLPILITAIAIGILLVAGGIALRSSQAKGIEVAIAATQTASVTDTPSPTASDTPTSTNTFTPTSSPTNTLTPSPGPSATPTASHTPSPTPVPPKQQSIDTGGYATPSTPPPTAIPTPVDAVAVPADVVNILLLGSDRRPDGGGYRTDTIIVVSINRREGTVNMLSIPRDLYVYIPGWTMNRVNTADIRGQAVGWKGGGPGLIKETLLYNFGIVIHHYARVDLSGFQDIVDTIGGVDVSVDCAIQGYVLREPRYRADDFATYEEWEEYTGTDENWTLYTLPVGVHHLDGYMSLWYARQRKGSTDFDRARRQQQVLRAILKQSQTLGLLTQIPQIYNQYGDLVETDMGLGNLLQLGPVAGDIDSSKIRSLILGPEYLTPWVETGTGANVYLPNPEAVPYLIAQAMQPPADNYVKDNTVTVEVRNGTSFERLDEVAADRLSWEFGLLPISTGTAPDGTNYTNTVIYDFTGRSKASQLLTLQRVLRVSNDNVIVSPDPNRVVDYVVVLGQDYNSCTYKAQIPIQEPTKAPTSTPDPTATP